MKGILGERKAYGQHSPQHSLFVKAGVPYRGTRTSNGYQKAPWYLYQSYPGSQLIDLDAFEKQLLAAGFYVPDDNRHSGPNARHYHRDTAGTQGESLHVVNYVFEKKPAKNYSHIGHIFFV